MAHSQSQQPISTHLLRADSTKAEKEMSRQFSCRLFLCIQSLKVVQEKRTSALRNPKAMRFSFIIKSADSRRNNKFRPFPQKNGLRCQRSAQSACFSMVHCVQHCWKLLNVQVPMKHATFCVARTSTFLRNNLITSSQRMAGIFILPIHSMFRSRVR